jgi:hypothetical protein
VNAGDGTAEVGVSIQVGSTGTVTSDDSGFFQTTVNGAGTYAAIVRSSGTVERQTTVSAPDSDARLSLIPASFDLSAFDELARSTHSRLQRWTTKPSLVVIVPVLLYTPGVEDTYIAAGDKMTDLEASNMITHLTEGLSILTGGSYTAFGSTVLERPAPGDAVSVKRPGKIVVGRYTGIAAGDGTIGYGTWLEDSDGAIGGGAIFLDEAFDHGDSRRRLLRIHELGHALGYQHVTSRTSIMNPVIGPEPTDFDRMAATIAFQPPPGNRAPDHDPEPASRVGSHPAGGARWAPPIP